MHSDMMLLQLGLRERRRTPTLFPESLKEIREAEENEAARHRMTAKPNLYNLMRMKELALSHS